MLADKARLVVARQLTVTMSVPAVSGSAPTVDTAVREEQEVRAFWQSVTLGDTRFPRHHSRGVLLRDWCMGDPALVPTGGRGTQRLMTTKVTWPSMHLPPTLGCRPRSQRPEALSTCTAARPALALVAVPCLALTLSLFHSHQPHSLLPRKSATRYGIPPVMSA